MKHKTQKEMEDLLKSYQSYRGKQKDFCQAHGIKAHTLHYWRHKLSKSELDNKGDKFIPIEVKETKLSNQDLSIPIEIGYPNGNSIRLPSTASIHLIHQLLQIHC